MTSLNKPAKRSKSHTDYYGNVCTDCKANYGCPFFVPTTWGGSMAHGAAKNHYLAGTVPITHPTLPNPIPIQSHTDYYGKACTDCKANSACPFFVPTNWSGSMAHGAAKNHARVSLPPVVPIAIDTPITAEELHSLGG